MGGPYNRSGCFVGEGNHLPYPEIEPRSFCRIAQNTAKIPPVCMFYLGVARRPPSPEEAWNELWIEEYSLTVEETEGPDVRLLTNGVTLKSGSHHD